MLDYSIPFVLNINTLCCCEGTINMGNNYTEEMGA